MDGIKLKGPVHQASEELLSVRRKRRDKRLLVQEMSSTLNCGHVSGDNVWAGRGRAWLGVCGGQQNGGEEMWTAFEVLWEVNSFLLLC